MDVGRTVQDLEDDEFECGRRSVASAVIQRGLTFLEQQARKTLADAPCIELRGMI